MDNTTGLIILILIILLQLKERELKVQRMWI
ncbi:TPA: leucine-rich repeat domain-containing protein, partial [Bacillus cereus]